MDRMHRHPPTTVTSSGSGLFRRTYEVMLGARQRQARPYAAYFLLSLDDEALDSLGYERHRLENQGSKDPF